MQINLYDYQIDAVERLDNGNILCGGVGSGKSRTSLAYYYTVESGGKIKGLFDSKSTTKMKYQKDLYIITTARKRDTKEWEEELAPFGINTDKVVIDSWNNIKKYSSIKNSFFIFDEQRVVGSGVWVKSFLKIANKNRWILLSATPGDTWSDYIPVFIANGFYKDKTDFIRQHAVYNRYSKYPKIDRYINQGKLSRFRNTILVSMDYERKTNSRNEIIKCDYDKKLYTTVSVDRWDPYNNCPIENPSMWFYVLRKVVNSDNSRIEAVKRIHEKHKKIIVFYNFVYELDILKNTDYGDAVVSEWNGSLHQPIPDSDSWVYLVQYTAGAEGWNCISTNVIVFYSQNYSYKIMVQSAGRIDRLNTPFDILYYYRLKSNSPIDAGIAKALNQKKSFNENSYLRKLEARTRNKGYNEEKDAFENKAFIFLPERGKPC